jgi:hypothetical protein
MLQPASRCRAAVPLAAPDPIQASEAKAPLAESRGVCAALWTRMGFDVNEAVPLTASSVPAAQAVETRLMCGSLVLARSSRGPRRLSASASASASGLGSAHGPNTGPLSSVGCRGETGHRGPSREVEPCLLLGRAAGAARATGAGARPLCRGPAGFGGASAAGHGARQAARRAKDGGASRCWPVWAGAYVEASTEWEARRGS